MILDTLQNSALYNAISPRMARAFELIAGTDWTTVEPGIHELDGRDIYVNVMDVELKRPGDAKLEVHDAYIDIQVLVRGEREAFGWSPRSDVRKPLGEFDVEKDIRFYDDEPQCYYTLRPGQFRLRLPVHSCCLHTLLVFPDPALLFLHKRPDPTHRHLPGRCHQHLSLRRFQIKIDVFHPAVFDCNRDFINIDYFCHKLIIPEIFQKGTGYFQSGTWYF